MLFQNKRWSFIKAPCSCLDLIIFIFVNVQARFPLISCNTNQRIIFRICRHSNSMCIIKFNKLVRSYICLCLILQFVLNLLSRELSLNLIFRNKYQLVDWAHSIVWNTSLIVKIICNPAFPLTFNTFWVMFDQLLHIYHSLSIRKYFFTNYFIF